MLSPAAFFDDLSRREMTVRVANFLNGNALDSPGQLASLTRAQASSLHYIDESGDRHDMNPETFAQLEALLAAEGLEFGMCLGDEEHEALDAQAEALREERTRLEQQLAANSKPPPPALQALLDRFAANAAERVPPEPRVLGLPELQATVLRLRARVESSGS